MRLLLVAIAMSLAFIAEAQDSLAMAKIDTVKRDTVVVESQPPVRPVKTLGKVSAIDTLATESEMISIILFNDNTWRYVMSENYKADSEVFSDHWNTTATHAYSDVELNSLPEATPILLVDSLESYHYPYMGRITSRYGPRRGRAHQGLDISLKTGDPIYATFDGKVRFSKAAGNYGNLVIIRHNNGLETYYAHLSQRDVEVGDWVVAGQQIGLGGSTGRSTGPHLHFEVRYKGQSFDPERIIDFTSGDLRRAELLLKRRHFSIYAKYEQDFDAEVEVEKIEEAER
jgi:murein DD-endopeptidase MepM/ murein hydrolase activator NlpD